MTFWRSFHFVNECIAFICGFSLNILLLIVIKKVEIRAMKKYNILLFQCCCVDMLQVILSFSVKPVVVVQHKNLYFLSNGFFRRIGGWIEMIGIIFWSISVFFCINSMPVSYIFRYKTVCLNTKISKRFYMISLIVAFFSASTFGMLMWKFHYLDNRNTVNKEEAFSWLMADDTGKVKAASVCLTVSISAPKKTHNRKYITRFVSTFSFQGTLGMLLSIVDAFLITFVPYIIMILYHIKILRYLKHHHHSLSPASRRVQNDLNRILTAQAIIPIFFAFLPVAIHIFSVIVDVNLVFLTFIGGILYCWIPVGNAICVLFLITAYREKLKHLILRKKLQLPRIVSVTGTMIGTSS